MIEVNIDFVINALEMRYNDVKNQWGCEASHDLWEQALDLVRECGFGCSSASEYVDNYLINGEFVSKHTDVEYWLNETSYKDCKEQLDLDGDEFDQWLDDSFDSFWQEYCQDNALIYNDEYACLQF